MRWVGGIERDEGMAVMGLICEDLKSMSLMIIAARMSRRNVAGEKPTSLENSYENVTWIYIRV